MKHTSADGRLTLVSLSRMTLGLVLYILYFAFTPHLPTIPFIPSYYSSIHYLHNKMGAGSDAEAQAFTQEVQAVQQWWKVSIVIHPHSQLFAAA